MKFLKGQIKKPKKIIALLIITVMIIGIISLIPSKNNIVYANPPADTVYISTPMGSQELGRIL